MAKKNTGKIIGGIVMTLIGLVYLANITFGVLELISDNLALVGNIDEGVAGGMVLQGLKLIFG